MATLFEVAREGAGITGPRQTFWERTNAGWFDPPGAAESAFLSPGRLSAWGRSDETSRDASGALDPAADRRVIEAVRRRALGGDPRAQALTFRASRGIARSVDTTARPSEAEALPSEVAAIMIEAGLTAINAYSRGHHDPLAL